jgi:16S rRNA (cytosine967-C5)-methyltransferase
LKVFKGLATAVVSALQEIFLRHKQADRVIEQVLKSNNKWGARDRAYIAENAYEMVRWWRLIQTVSDIRQTPQPEQLWLMFGVWHVIKSPHLKHEAAGTLPEWIEFSEIDRESVLEKYRQVVTIRKIAQSIPDWLDEIGEKELGPDLWEVEIAAMNNTAPLVLRVNSLLTTPAAVKEILGSENTISIDDIPSALVLKKRQNITNLPSFKMGYFEVQDAGSQLIAPFH